MKAAGIKHMAQTTAWVPDEDAGGWVGARLGRARKDGGKDRIARTGGGENTSLRLEPVKRLNCYITCVWELR